MRQLKEMNASDAKRLFGEMLINAQDHPIGVNKNGKLTAVMISAREYETYETLKEQFLKTSLEQGIASLEAGRTHDGDSVIDDLKLQL